MFIYKSLSHTLVLRLDYLILSPNAFSWPLTPKHTGKSEIQILGRLSLVTDSLLLPPRLSQGMHWPLECRPTLTPLAASTLSGLCLIPLSGLFQPHLAPEQVLS